MTLDEHAQKIRELRKDIGEINAAIRSELAAIDRELAEIMQSIPMQGRTLREAQRNQREAFEQWIKANGFEDLAETMMVAKRIIQHEFFID